MVSRITKNATTVAENIYELGSGSTYTKVGSLTNNQGVFSNFSVNNYITTNCTFSAWSDKLEIYGSFKTGLDLTSSQLVVSLNPRNLNYEIAGSKIRLSIFNNNNNWVVYSGTTILDTNTKYNFKIISDNIVVKAYLLINGDWFLDSYVTLPTESNSGSMSLGIFLPNNPHTSPLKGYLDIKDYEVKISGKTVWNGLDAYLLNNKAKIGKFYIGASDFFEV